MNLAFINYRRSDSKQAARGLYAQLQHRLGRQHVFMDVSSIAPAAEWPNRIEEALAASSVLIPVIGDGWLSSLDQYHRRRIDAPEDWVRREIALTIGRGIPILTVLVGESSVPPAEALPEDIRRLPQFQSIRLRDDSWEDDVERLLQWLINEQGFVENQKRMHLPPAEKTSVPLSTQEIDRLTTALPKWEPVESELPGEYPKTRHELRRVFRFQSFLEAIEFMNFVAPSIERGQHHPRWENVWRTVSVYLSTWDIGSRISAHDVKLAKDLDRLFEEFRRSKRLS